MTEDEAGAEVRKAVLRFEIYLSLLADEFTRMPDGPEKYRLMRKSYARLREAIEELERKWEEKDG